MRARGLTTALVFALVSLSVVAVLAEAELFEPGRFARSWRNAGIFVGDMFPPEDNPELLRTLTGALLETLRMAWAGTVIGACLALPLALLAATPLSHPGLSHAVRTLLAAIRTIPSILWAIFFVVIVGFGPLAGIFALATYTTGYLGKLFYEALEAADPELLDATRATGASRLQVARHAVIPESGNALLSQALFAFEYNVRASSILGLVGAGGFGFYLLRFLEMFEYEALATALVMMFLLVVVVDTLSRLVRKRFLSERSTSS